MIAFLPLNSHPDPKKVNLLYRQKNYLTVGLIVDFVHLGQILIVGGGDGGVAREVVKHPKVETVVQCEIDERVIEVSKQFFPFMSKGFDDPKLVLQIGDGFEFIKNHPSEFDVIITDSSDPIGNVAH